MALYCTKDQEESGKLSHGYQLFMKKKQKEKKIKPLI